MARWTMVKTPTATLIRLALCAIGVGSYKASLKSGWEMMSASVILRSAKVRRSSR